MKSREPNFIDDICSWIGARLNDRNYPVFFNGTLGRIKRANPKSRFEVNEVAATVIVFMSLWAGDFIIGFGRIDELPPEKSRDIVRDYLLGPVEDDQIDLDELFGTSLEDYEKSRFRRDHIPGIASKLIPALIRMGLVPGLV